MKIMVVFFLFILSFTYAAAQRENTAITKDTIGSIDVSYGRIVNLEIHDTAYYVLLGFQNVNAGKKIDIKSVYIKNKDAYDELMKDLNSAVQEIDSKSSFDVERDDYRLYINDFTNQLCFAENPEKGNAYTKLDKTIARKLSDWLRTFQFGKG